MLSARHRELLTAYVDDELEPPDRQLVRQLLRKSAPARKLLKQLQSDSRRLSALPHATLPAEFPQRVLAALTAEPVPAKIAAAVPVTAPLAPSWAAWLIAASLFLTVTTLSYRYFASDAPPAAVALLAELPVEGEEPQPLLHFSLVQIKEQHTRRQLQEHLHKNNAFQFDVTTHSNQQTVEHLAQALRKTGIELVRARHPNPQKQYLLLVENVHPHEVHAILEHLGATAAQSPAATTHVALHHLPQQKRTEVAALLGISAEQLQPAPTPQTNDDPMQLLKKQMLAAPRNKGAADRTKTAPRNAPRLAVVLAATEDMQGEAIPSAEIMRFLEARRPPQPGTLQLVFVLKQHNQV